MSNIKSVLNKVSMTQIPENALLDGVVKALQEREAFRDTVGTLNERIYYGDVFEAILNEQHIFKITDKKVLAQLEELAKLVDTDYVQVTMN